MDFATDSVQISITRAHDCLVVNIQTDLTEELLQALRERLLKQVEAGDVRGVVLDFSGLRAMDTEEFEAIRRLARMVELLGAPCVCAGLNAGIVSYLVSLNVDTRGVKATLGLDEALEWLEARERRG